MARLPVPLGAWKPDYADLNNPGVTEARNVVPAIDSFQPLKSAELFSRASMDSRPLGATAGTDSIGNAHVFGANASKLYRSDPQTQNWSNVSRSSGYATAADERWNFVSFGSLIIGTNFSDVPQAIDLNTGSKFADLTTLVRGRHIATSRGFTFLGHTHDALDGVVRHRVRWSGIENPTDWVPSVTTQSDWQDLPEGGAITGIIGGEAITVLQQKAITVFTYVGSPVIFQVDEISKIGCTVPESVITIGTTTFFLGEDGFYRLDGGQVTAIGTDVNQWFYGNADPSSLNRMTVVSDPQNKLIYWLFTSSDALDGTPDRFIIFNYLTNQWSYGDSGPVSYIFASQSLPTTLEQLDRYGSLENVPASLDSAIWAGGAGYLAGLDLAGNIYAFSGQTLTAVIETTEMAVGSILAQADGNVRGDRSIIAAVRPLVHGSSTIMARVGSRSTPMGNVTLGAASTVNANGVCPQRKEGRYHRVRMTLSGSWEKIVGLEIEATPTGYR